MFTTHCVDALLDRFTDVNLIDSEFDAPPGERQIPGCMVLHKLRSQQTIRLWKDDLRRLSEPPFSTDDNQLFVAYYATAEVSTFLALGWPPPVNWLDLFAEFRNATNGLVVPHGNGLLSAQEYHGLPSIPAADKEAGRALFLNPPLWMSEAERRLRGLGYCEHDTLSLLLLLDRMWPRIALDEALLRGAYMRALAFVEWESTPIDAPLYRRLAHHWPSLKRALIDEIDPHYGVYADTRFVSALFEAYLQRHDIAWPRLSSGALALDKVTFRDMARLHPRLNALHELRSTLAKARLTDLRIGSDHRNRCGLSAFRTVTSRNAPRASQFIFGPARWLRSLIQPPEGHGLAYCDWSAQELGLGAALAGDEAMMADYASGDPYVAFARRSRLIPPDGTRESHPEVREQCKTLELGLNYGMTVVGLAQRLDTSEAEARYLIELHHRVYQRFADYAERVMHTGAQGFTLNSVFGFRRHTDTDANPRSLRNWPMQTNGAEMMRLAAVAGIDAGLTVVTLVHDAALILTPLGRLEADATRMRDIMTRASEAVTGGFPLRVDIKLIRHPERYHDKHGAEMWARAMTALRRLEAGGETPDSGTRDQDDQDQGEDADRDQEGLAAFAGDWR